MTKMTALKVVNPLLGLALSIQALTGLFHALLPREVFETLHLWGGVVLLMIALLHVSLNWGWVRATYFRRA